MKPYLSFLACSKIAGRVLLKVPICNEKPKVSHNSPVRVHELALLKRNINGYIYVQ